MDNITPLFPAPSSPSHRTPHQVGFYRPELNAILGLYGRMVVAGLWRDYAMEFAADRAVFSAYKRASERAEVQIIKSPALARRQGAWMLVGQTGGILKRGHDLEPIIKLLERRLIKLV